MNDGTALRPGGAVEIPGFDPDHETYAKHEDQTVTVTYADESTADVTVKAGSYLRVYRQSDGRQYATTADTTIDLDNCSDDIEELEAPMAAGETLTFDFALLVTGAHENNVGVCVRVPPDPTGGFHVISQSVSGSWMGDAFGADSFNNPAGVAKGGIEGTRESHNMIRVRGVVGNGPRPGMLRIQLGPAEEGGGVMMIISDVTDNVNYVLKYDGSWTLVSTQDVDEIWFASPRSQYVPSGTIKTINGNYLFWTVSGISEFYPDGAWRSTDGGVTWTPVFDDERDAAHAIVESADGTLWASKINEDTGKFTIYKSTDGGETYTLNHEEDQSVEDDNDNVLNDTVLWQGAAHPTNASIIAFYGFKIVVEDTLGTNHQNDLWLRVTTNGGTSWTAVQIAVHDPAEPATGASNADSFEHKLIHFTDTGRLVFVANLDLPTVDDGILRIYYSDTYLTEESYTAVEVDTRTNDDFNSGQIVGGLTGTSTGLFIVANSSDDDESHVYMSTDNAATWTEIAQPKPGGKVLGLHYDPDDDALYALNDFNQTNVTTVLYRMANPTSGEGEWVDVTDGIPIDLTHNLGPIVPQVIWQA